MRHFSLFRDAVKKINAVYRSTICADVDGTLLLHSEHLYRSTVIHALTTLLRHPPTDLPTLTGVSEESAFNELAKQYQLAPHALKKTAEHELNRHLKESGNRLIHPILLPHIIALARQGTDVGLATNSSTKTLNYYSRHISLFAELLKIIPDNQCVTIDSLADKGKQPKPSADHFLTLIDEMPSTEVYHIIEDSKIGLTAAEQSANLLNNPCLIWKVHTDPQRDAELFKFNEASKAILPLIVD